MTKKVVMNGPRPSSLMINKDSHLIRKPSVSKTMILHKQQQRNDPKYPIIIYTESPKVIHTKAQDFMGLVQRLTGMSSSNEASENFGSSNLCDGSKSKKQGCSDHGDETSSAVGRDDVENSPSNYVGFADHDMPLFTPNSSHFICSYRSVVYKYSDSDSPYGILGSLISPSGLEFLKQLPEY